MDIKCELDVSNSVDSVGRWFVGCFTKLLNGPCEKLFCGKLELWLFNVFLEASLRYPVWIRKMIRTASNDRLLHSMPICKTARWRGSRFDGFWEPTVYPLCESKIAKQTSTIIPGKYHQVCGVSIAT